MPSKTQSVLVHSNLPLSEPLPLHSHVSFLFGNRLIRGFISFPKNQATSLELGTLRGANSEVHMMDPINMKQSNLVPKDGLHNQHKVLCCFRVPLKCDLWQRRLLSLKAHQSCQGLIQRCKKLFASFNSFSHKILATLRIPCRIIHQTSSHPISNVM